MKEFRTIWLLRAATVLVLVILAMRPVAVRPDPGMPTRWALLVDTSASMRVKDPEERLGRALRDAEEISRRFPSFDLFRFDGSFEKISRDALPSLKPTGRQSDLAGAIERAFAENRYRGAVVFSDGRHVGDGDPVSAAAAAGRPLFVVGYGDTSRFRDVAVRSIQSPPFAFKNVGTSISATLAVVGFSGKTVSVRLKEDGRIVGIQTIQVPSDSVETTVTFPWTPGSLGTKVLTAEADNYTGEATVANNRKEVVLDVGRDRFRVLYICGEPGPEYGFLRHQFKSDPAVELVTFVILRNASNVVSVPEGELSLIPFPTQDVLINQMATFDLIVFEEFSYSSYGLSPNVLFAIRKKVEDGGSFLLMGEQTAFGAGSPYGITGIREMIPVDVGSVSRITPGPLAFIPKALSHPILKMDENPESNKRIWSELPPLEDIALVMPAKAGATVLGSVSEGGTEHPVLTVWRFGKGRVAALTTRTTWRWSMVPGKGSGVFDVYPRFWKNMVLWLTHADEFKTVRVAFRGRDIRRGEPETLRVWAYDEYFKPIGDVDVRVQVIFPDKTQASFSPTAETTGVFSIPFTSEQLGDHEVQAWVTRRGKRLGQDKTRVRVVEGHSEDEDLRPDVDGMRELAEATGGRYASAEVFRPADLDGFDQEVSRSMGRKVLVWNSPWLLGLFLVLLGLEWWIRRRRGLP